MKIRKGDRVRILSGKDMGKEGKVELVLGKDQKVFVGEVNLYKRHVKKQGTLEGGIINIPKPVDVSSVALICPNCKKATRVGFVLKDSKKIRICKKCTKEINE